MDSETLIFLLKGGHINMEERVAKGIWPHPALRMQDLTKEIVAYLQEDRWFPYEWIERRDGELIDDVTTIEKVDEQTYICRSREASPSDLQMVGREEREEFASPQEAAEWYLRNELRLPGDLDGWRVIE